MLGFGGVRGQIDQKNCRPIAMDSCLIAPMQIDLQLITARVGGISTRGPIRPAMWQALDRRYGADRRAGGL